MPEPVAPSRLPSPEAAAHAYRVSGPLPRPGRAAGIRAKARPPARCLAAGIATMLSGGAVAQETAPTTMDPITVEDSAAPANNLRRGLGLGRIPGTVQDQPQTIQVIPQEIMVQQGTTTLEQALRNVPSVTVAVGEGNGGMNGDMFRIRGFDAKGDIYVDGLRDFGVYVRDSFNMEQVEVLKGPSSVNFGMGTTGAAINTVSKTPRFDDDFYGGTAAVGNADTRRATIDVNQAVNDKVAVRMNAMVHQSHVEDRDGIQNDRWGLAPSVGLKLGDATNYSLVYFYQNTDRIPDYGVPVATRPGKSVGKPVTEYGVDQSNWYGKFTDEDKSQVHMVTGRLDHQLNEYVTLYNDTRIGYAKRDFSPSPVNCNADCSLELFSGGDPQYSFGGGGGPTYKQDSWGAQNITSAVADFRIGAFRNQGVAGIDVFYQHDERDGYSYDPGKTGGDLFDPDNSDLGYNIVRNPANDKKADAYNYAFFVTDRFWITEQWSVLGGVRFDYYDSEYTPNQASDKIESTSLQINPRASLIYEPTRNQTYYASYARSSSPPGQFITNSPNPLNEDTADLDPETNDTFEVGGKVSVLDGRLGLTGAVFVVYKDRVTEEEPDGTIIASSASRQRVQGAELGVTGVILDGWVMNAAYTYLNGEIRGATDEANVGNDVPNAPENSFAVWSTYDVSTLIPTGPGRLLLGGGVTYQDPVYTNDGNSQRVPSSLSYDGVVSYEYDNWRLALNGYNLADRLNYAGTQGGRVVPAAGRTFLLSLGATF